MKSNPLMIIVALAIGTTIPFSAIAEEPVEVLRAQINELEKDLARPMENLNEQYESRLTTFKGETETSGNLSLAMEISNEIEKFRTGTKPSNFPALKNLQLIYAKETGKLRLEQAKMRLELYGAYLKRLKDAEDFNVQAGLPDVAKQYADEAESVEEKLKEINDYIASVAVKPSLGQPGTTEESKLKEGPEFVAGVYRIEGTFFHVTFTDDGKFDTHWAGSGSWKNLGGGEVAINRTDKLRYEEDEDVWAGRVNIGREQDIKLKYVSKVGEYRGRGPFGDGRGFRDRDRDRDRRRD